MLLTPNEVLHFLACSQLFLLQVLGHLLANLHDLRPLGPPTKEMTPKVVNREPRDNANVVAFLAGGFLSFLYFYY
jgi:hypothetical protein